ncbi:hypothetical protein DRE_01301 [Drechslerella stenobrocha 248]|uniref:Uncharacterized protein n=1 Tax=Drechslerella stenobrocha 248 TaxID=1043628 RepID=W7HLJ7_9PEZI|nr:hypothetical protein DRE_01301 [Drechslerella stenobrocha 248]
MSADQQQQGAGADLTIGNPNAAPPSSSRQEDVGRLVGPIIGIVAVLVVFVIIVYLWRRETKTESDLEKLRTVDSDIDLVRDSEEEERAPTPKLRSLNRDAPKIRSVHFDSFADNILPPPYTKDSGLRRPDPAVVH